MSSSTDWGAVETDVIAWIRAGLTAADTRTVKSMISELRADTFQRGVNSVFTHSHGTSAHRSGKGGGGYITLEEDWVLDVLIYSASGRQQDSDRLAIQTLAAKVKGRVNGYTPNGQLDSTGFLELRRDAPAEEFGEDASSGLKVRQTYVLHGLLQTQITGAAAA